MPIGIPEAITDRGDMSAAPRQTERSAAVPGPRTVAAAAVTRIPIPRPKPGSWTTMFEALFSRGGHPIDYLICPPVPEGRRLPSVQYLEASDTSVPVLRRYMPGSRFVRFFRRVKQLQDRHDHLVLMVIDDYNFLFSLDEWLRRTGTRERTSILFFIQGMSYFFEGERAVAFYRSLDEIIYLTHASYSFERARTREMPCEASVVWNAVDRARFHPIDRAAKAAFRASIGLNPDGVCFLWLSRDQPKKGLHIVLRAWAEFVTRHDDVQLAVIGAAERESIEGVRFFGAIPNRDVAPFVQMADIYLFPTLWAEGFGLSLAEAISAGLLAIASDIGPMSEVLGSGRYGCLVGEPHVVGHWRSAMELQLARFVENGHRNPYQQLEPERYSLDVWCRDISGVVQKWKTRALATQSAPSAP
jgi:glycosyltransferase involved in cell wall biosynthesis